MIYVIVAVLALITGGVVCGIGFTSAISAQNYQHRKKPPKKRRFEYSKLILTLVLSTYFVGVGLGVWVVIQDFSQLYAVLTFIGAPTAAALGFYTWKAKAENMIKLKKAHPGEDVDLNNIQT
jgi:arginine exporter protein ArgO